MENILYANAVLPYLYLVSTLMLSKIPQLGEEIGGLVYCACGIGILLQILVSIVVSVLSEDKQKLALVNKRVKMIQIPFYIIYFVLASMIFAVLMALMGMGIFLLPVLLAVDAAIFASTMIPSEFCAVELRTCGKISAFRMVVYLMTNCWYCVDVLIAWLMCRDFKKRPIRNYPPQPQWR